MNKKGNYADQYLSNTETKNIKLKNYVKTISLIVKNARENKIPTPKDI